MSEFTNENLDPVSLPSVESLSFTKLEKRYLNVMLLWRSVFLVFIIPLIIFELLDVMEYGYLFSTLLFLIIILWCVVGLLAFSKKGYAVREKDITYKRGLVFERTTTIPISRIQHSEIQRGLFARLFEVATLKIYTAGGAGSDISIPGLSVPTAERLRGYLNQQLEENE